MSRSEKAAAATAWREANPARYREYKRRYEADNRESLNAQRRERYEVQDRESLNAQRRERYRLNKQK